MMEKERMDKWKRGRNGVLINDDAAGYDNARKRVALKAQRRSEIEELKERMARLEAKTTEMENALTEAVSLCRSLVDAIRR